MTPTEGPPRGGDCADGPEVVCLSANASEDAPKTAPAQENLLRNPGAVAATRRGLQLFLHECAGGIAVHAELVKTFTEIGDLAGVCYAMRQLFAHAKAAHPIYLELRDGADNGAAP